MSDTAGFYTSVNRELAELREAHEELLEELAYYRNGGFDRAQPWLNAAYESLSVEQTAAYLRADGAFDTGEERYWTGVCDGLAIAQGYL